MVVEIHPEDFPEYAKYGPLALMEFQEELERQCWMQGGRRQTAPAQRMVDFTRGKLGATLPDSSYSPDYFFSASLLDATVHYQKIISRVPAIREVLTRIPDE